MPESSTCEVAPPTPASGGAGGLRRLPGQLAIGLLRVYQATLSRLLGPRCRFHPSCSQYTLEAISKYGLVRGALLGARRVVRCHPFHDGGFDPVP